MTNLTAFGAFVDIGVHQDGLVHLSQIADRFVKNPGEVLKVRQPVEVTVLAVDLERKRISLTLKKSRRRAENRPIRLRKRRSGRTRPPGKDPGRKSLGKPPQERQEHGRPQREKPGQGRPKQGKPRDEKVPFNNPFAAVFGKK